MSSSSLSPADSLPRTGMQRFLDGLALVPVLGAALLLGFIGLACLYLGRVPEYGNPDPKQLPFGFLRDIAFLCLAFSPGIAIGTAVVALARMVLPVPPLPYPWRPVVLAVVSYGLMWIAVECVSDDLRGWLID